MADIPNSDSIFNPLLPSGEIAADSLGTLGRPRNVNRALSLAIGTAFAQIVDTVNISAAARMAEDLHYRIVRLTGSDRTEDIRGIHPVINGIANLKETARKLASGR